MVLCAAVMLFGSTAVFASDDNSLYSLGITTEGVEVTPEFSYDHWEYDVTVPAGTEKLELEPVPSNEAAKIAEVSGTQIAQDGTATVYITVEAQTGSQFTYTLHVTSDAGPVYVETEPPTEKATEKVTEKVTEKPKETEPVTEDANYVKVPRDTVDQAERTIKDLQGEIVLYRDTTNLYTKIIFGMIAACVVLLFLVINLALRKRDLKNEVKEYRSLGYVSSKQQKKMAQKAAKACGKQQGNLQRSGYPGAGPGQQPPYPQAPAGGVTGSVPYPQAPAGNAPGTASYPDRSGIYYEKAHLDVTPQVSSRNMKNTAPVPAAAVPAGQKPAQAPVNTPPAANAAETADRTPQAAQDPKSGAGTAPQAPPAGDPGKAKMPEKPAQAPGSPGRGKKNRKEVEINMVDL